jgi:hypothetical protein
MIYEIRAANQQRGRGVGTCFRKNLGREAYMETEEEKEQVEGHAANGKKRCENNLVNTVT